MTFLAPHSTCLICKEVIDDFFFFLLDACRIRELMQPMMAKLPSLLLASKAKRVTTTASGRRSSSDSGSEKPETATSRATSAASLARPQSSHSVASTSTTTTTSSCASSRRARGEGSAKHHSNQETHEEGDASASMPHRPHAPALAKKTVKTKKKATPPLSALEEVQRRKKMFSKWIKTAATEAPEAPATASEPSRENSGSSSSVNATLPLIRRRMPTTEVGPDARRLPQQMTADEDDADDAFRLPPLRQPPAAHGAVAAAVAAAEAVEWDFLQPYEPSKGLDEAPCQPDFEDSLDEDEVNNLLNWTDTLLSPGAMDEFPLLDEDADTLAVG